MLHKNFPIILYWIAGGIPSQEDKIAAANLGPGVRFRNANHDTKDGALEDCDYVAGPDIPKRYTDQDSKHRKPAAIPYADWLRRKQDMEQRQLAKPGDEVTETVTVHGGPDGKGGTLPPREMVLGANSGANRPGNVMGATAASQTDEFGFTLPGAPGYREPVPPAEAPPESAFE